MKLSRFASMVDVAFALPFGADTCVARRRYSVTYFSMLPRAALPAAASRIQMASQNGDSLLCHLARILASRGVVTRSHTSVCSLAPPCPPQRPASKWLRKTAIVCFAVWRGYLRRAAVAAAHAVVNRTYRCFNAGLYGMPDSGHAPLRTPGRLRRAPAGKRPGLSRRSLGEGGRFSPHPFCGAGEKRKRIYCFF